ncbi:sensor domain-containing diguanylate cyclase [Vibrio maerlii]|uniref:sensor domain-containing diguanylate cyclase n=1 Tax=Vibrio maerlii TaxID=2231648 RepID=UPI000E3DE00B|nr:sensor domain-containing diguanylate cyclase [Vibrio maerlii]
MSHNIGGFNLESMLNALPDRVFVISESGKFLKLYGGKESQFDYQKDSMIGMSFYDIFHFAPEQADRMKALINEALDSNGARNITYQLSPETFPDVPGLKVPDSTQWFEGRVQALPHTVDGHRAVVWVARNVTENEQLKSELKKKAEQDYLTGLLNKRSLDGKVRQLIERKSNEPCDGTLLLLDIDHFKKVNDTYGHLTGDDVIQAVASIIKNNTDEFGYSGRIGGEEFGGLLCNMSDEQATDIAESIRQQVEAITFTSINGDSFSITISIGIGKIEPADTLLSQVFHRSDTALYVSKESGRNQVNWFK